MGDRQLLDVVGDQLEDVAVAVKRRQQRVTEL